MMGDSVLIKRASGGFLALSGPSRAFRIGVPGRTENEALTALAEAEAAWTANLAATPPSVASADERI